MASPTPTDDRVSALLSLATELLRSRSDGHAGVEELLAALDGLRGREVARFDERSRTWHSGFGSGQIAQLRSRWRRGGSGHRLWTVLALVSADGFERQAAIEAVAPRRGTVALLALRSADWVPQVRAAALARLEEAPPFVLLGVLPLVDVLTQERERTGDLDALVERRLGDEDLRAATRGDDEPARRAAWRRLAARGALTGEELRTRVARDPDVAVRALAVRGLDAAGDERERRALAEILVADPVGWLAARGLAVLVELDGAPPIVAALGAPSATLRRHARDWARLRGVDARAVLVTRLERDPADAVALMGLLEIGDRADRDLLLNALGDPRSRVRAGALRAIARLDDAAARAAALDALEEGQTGRVGRAAVTVLRGAPLGAGERARVVAVARDARRPARERLRALALLRRARWPHLALLLELRHETADGPLREQLDEELRQWIATSGRVRRGPDASVRNAVEALLPTVDAASREAIAFVLRTAA